MINDGPATKVIHQSDPTSPDGATIHEIDSNTNDEPICEVLIDDVPPASSPNVQSPSTTDILDNILEDNMENEDLPVESLNNEATVADLLQESDEMDFPTPDLEDAVTGDIKLVFLVFAPFFLYS